jgi:hypothetical protein
METLKKIAIDNGRIAGPRPSHSKRRIQDCKWLRVLHLQMAGTMQGIKFFYYGYYFSNGNGTVQFVTYSAQNLLDTFKSDIEELLNGFGEL